jgi:HK97 family phage portal protein
VFWGSWLASEDIFGEAYAEIERNAMGQPARLWLLNPLNMRPIAGKGKDGSPIKGYEYNIAGRVVILPAEDVLVRRNKDLTNVFWGLSPLQVAMGAVDMDTAQTDFVRAFFNNGGVPSGLLKYVNGTLTAERAEEARQRFMAKYGRGGRGSGGVAVLDQNMEYQKVGADLGELESDSLRCQAESRICSVFGVPPILVGAYVGLLHVNQRASVKEAQTDFWINTMSPLFKALRTFLTWNLLPEFESIEMIEAEKVRVGWDMSRVMALQEDTDKRHDRARKDFQAGGITLNEFRAMIGERPDETNGDYYLRPTMTIAQTPEVALIEAEKLMVEPKQLTAGDADEDAKTAKIVEGLRRSLIEQVEKELKQFGDLQLLSLVPPPRVYAELQKLMNEQAANILVADTVAEIQAKALAGEFVE